MPPRCTRYSPEKLIPRAPHTQGKLERFHQTQKKLRSAQPVAEPLTQLQQQLPAFQRAYNTKRPHRSLKGRKRVLMLVDDTSVTIIELSTDKAFTQHLIQPERSYWPDMLKPQGRWPNQ